LFRSLVTRSPASASICACMLCFPSPSLRKCCRQKRRCSCHRGPSANATPKMGKIGHQSRDFHHIT
jgi:hypothetical protein